MKKTMILAAFAALISLASCQKENEAAGTRESLMIINAVAQGVACPTKAELAYRYDILWQSGDEICVRNGSTNSVFTLVSGAETTEGTFEGDASLTGEVKAVYPASLVSGSDYKWPAVQTSDLVVPMYCKKTLSGSGTENFSFTSLGSVLQIVYNTTARNKTLKSIEIRDGAETMSGGFIVADDGSASIIATDGAGVTLDLGEGTAVGISPKYFHLAIPAGKYEDLTLTFTATDNSKCVMTGGRLDVKHNTVGRLVLTGNNFHKDLVLPGEFSVGADRKVKFSRGNLYYDGNSFQLEENQYDYTMTRAAGYVGSFYWSRNASVAVADSYSDPDAGESDIFFTNKTAYLPNPDFTVSGRTGEFRSMTPEEWSYLLGSRSQASNLNKDGVTVCGVDKCLVIAPDNYEGTIKDAYTDADWIAAEEAGLVCLPPTEDDGSYAGVYWLSTTSGENAHCLPFTSLGVVSNVSKKRSSPGAVRLVCPMYVAVTGIALDKASLDLYARQSIQLEATVEPEYASDRSVIWSSDNTSVATVDGGLVIAVSGGTATITATTIDGGETASCTVTVKPVTVGVFTVNASGKKVRFSPSNMYWDGDSFEFEASQYNSPEKRSSDHIGYFYWSNSASVAIAGSYSDSGRANDDVLFTNETETSAKADFTAGGVTGKFRTLSKPEWSYLYENHTSKIISIDGMSGNAIAPDGFKGTINDSYTVDEWRKAESEGLVFLMMAGDYYNYGINKFGGYGRYWTSSPWNSDQGLAVFFSSGLTFDKPAYSEFLRSNCYVIRLVMDE